MGRTSQESQWASLLAAGNEGDGGAYRRFLLELTPVLRAFARKGLAGADLADADAEDIVQETLLAIQLGQGGPGKPMDLGDRTA